MRRISLAALMALCAAVVLAQGPLTPIGQLKGRTDANGYLITTGGAYVAPDGPLTPIGQLRGRTDANGYLLTALTGGPISPTSVSIAQGTLTADAQALSSTATWNAAGVTFTHWKAVITDTASAVGSLAVNILGGPAGSTTLFSLGPTGTATFGSSVIAGAATNIGWGGGTQFKNPSDGVIELCNNGCSDFSRLQFGGTTSSFPSLKRTTTQLISRLADDSGDADFGAQTFNASNRYSLSSSGDFFWVARSRLLSPSDGVIRLANQGDTDFSRLQFGGTTSSFPGLARSGTRLEQVLGDGTSGGVLASSGAYVTQGSATGLTVADAGSLRTQVYKVTVATTAFVCAATTCDLTIGTLPANTWLTNAIAQVTTTFACTATCTTGTLSMILGKGAGGAEYLASFDADAATAYFGDADAEMGTLMTRAAAIQGGTFTSGTQAVVLRLTSGTGNIGSGSVTNLSQGALTIWITTNRLP